MLQLMLVKRVWGVPLDYAERHHIKLVHISHGYITFLNLDKVMIVRAPIVDAKSNLKMTQDLDRVYVNGLCDTFKIYNALVYHILLKIFIDMDANVYMKERKNDRTD